MPSASPARPRPNSRLTAPQRSRLDAGEHDALARELLDTDPELSAWIWERIWDFEQARDAYLRARLPLEALRCALDGDARAPESSGVPVVLQALSASEGSLDESEAVRSQAVRLLEARGRHSDAAQLLAREAGREEERAELLARDGDVLGAAQLLHERGESQRALAILGALREGPGAAPRFAMASLLEWELGDAEGCARHAQAALRCASEDDVELRQVCERRLVGALQALGHRVAAEIVAARRAEEGGNVAAATGEHRLAPMRGRFHVTGTVNEPWIGAAYLAIDRLSLAPVEVHLLLADLAASDRVSRETQAALDHFARSVRASQAVGHAAIRSVLYLDQDAGVLVMPRADGPSAATWIRAGLMQGKRLAVRAAVRFLIEGLAAAHAAGAVHGGVVPSSVSTDALGRLVLGPFGGHALSGLMATRTGSLEELLRFTAPELRGSELVASEQGDVFAVGMLWQSLLLGPTPDPADLAALHRDEPVLAQLVEPDPQRRPPAALAYERMASPVADLTDVVHLDPQARKGAGISSDPVASARGLSSQVAKLMPATQVQPHASIPAQVLTELATLATGLFQAVLDRDPVDVHAPWTLAHAASELAAADPSAAAVAFAPDDRGPTSKVAAHVSATAGPQAGPESAWDFRQWAGWQALLERVSPTLRRFLETQVDASDWEQLDSQAHLLRLDRLLTRAWQPG